MNNGCLCITCTCTGCHEECFGHCNACGGPTTDCNSYQTDGEKYSSFSSKNDDTQPKNKEENQCQKEPALNRDAAATIKSNVAPLKAETSTTQQGAGGLSVPVSPVDAGAATQSLSGVETASLAANTNQAFDYSGMNTDTAKRLQNLAQRAMAAKQRYVLELMEIVVEAHRELVQRLDKLQAGGVVARCDNSKHGNRGDATFRTWCASIGVGKDTAYRLLQVQALMDGSTPEEQEVLAEVPAKLLYAAAKPSAPVELVQGVKDGDITTHKQYQEAMAQLKAAQQAQANAEQKLADEQRRRQQSDEERIAAQNQAQHYKEMKDAALETLKGERDAAAQKIKRQAEIIAMRERELAEESDRADAAEQRVTELESRPVEVAVQEPDPAEVKRLANEKAAEMTAMYKAQINTLKEQMDDAERRAQYGQDSTYMAAAEFAEQAAATIHGIRTAFWTLAKELSEEDFLLALEPLDDAVKRIYGREWED